eukprot:TRINITY_DN351_c2_g1_i1.p2 TRINITY_DN351_c2_g1~~TRINITY_DN351_c2_g1_i1.p2  ORF type:complete len:197 (-),score=-10.54 TRINITY_DN351_c2_g1_i1:393-983(-)
MVRDRRPLSDQGLRAGRIEATVAVGKPSSFFFFFFSNLGIQCFYMKVNVQCNLQMQSICCHYLFSFNRPTKFQITKFLKQICRTFDTLNQNSKYPKQFTSITSKKIPQICGKQNSNPRFLIILQDNSHTFIKFNIKLKFQHKSFTSYNHSKKCAHIIMYSQKIFQHQHYLPQNYMSKNRYQQTTQGTHFIKTHIIK